jgi:hypothetical protein
MKPTGPRFADPFASSGLRTISGSGRYHPAEAPAAARGGAADQPPAGGTARAAQVRMKPSTSDSAQASVFSNASPCMNRTTILVWIAWV